MDIFKSTVPFFIILASKLPLFLVSIDADVLMSRSNSVLFIEQGSIKIYQTNFIFIKGQRVNILGLSRPLSQLFYWAVVVKKKKKELKKERVNKWV